MSTSPAVRGDRRLDNPSIINQFDRPQVVVRRAPGQPAVTNALPIVFEIEFDEPVIDFPVGMNVGGIVFSGTAAGLQYESSGEEASYQVTIRAVDQDGDIALAVPAQLTADLFGNVNTESTQQEAFVRYDATRPQSVIQSEQQGVVNDADMNITLVFSEPVYGLRDSALTVENATVKRVAGGEGNTHYQFVVTPREDGTAALTVPEDAVTDAVGNGNTASPFFSLIVDSTEPEVQLSSFETPQASNSWVIRVHAVFNEPVYDFVSSDVVIQGGALMNFSASDDGQRYLFDVKPTESFVQLSVPAGVTRDAIGNPNNASNLFQREIDRTRPTVQIEVPTQSPGGERTTLLQVIFSEPVYDFVPGELHVAGGRAQWHRGEDGDSTYEFLVVPTGSRRVTAALKSGVATDLAGNPNKAVTKRFTPSRTSSVGLDYEEAGKDAPPLIGR